MSFPDLCYTGSFPQHWLPGVRVMFSGLDSVRAAHSPHCSSLPRYLLATHSVPEANDTASDKTEGHGIIKNSPGGQS